MFEFKRSKKFFQKRRDSFRRGLGTRFISDGWGMMRGLLRSIFTLPESNSEEAETFDEAMYRLGLTEKNLQEQHQGFLRQAYLFLFFSAVIAIYAIFLVFNLHLIAGIVTFAMAVMLSVLGLRSHFWAFQISQRKLGCTLHEWLNGKASSYPISTSSKGDV